MPGVLLDTHTLYWLVTGNDPLTEESLVAIGDSQESGALLASPITAWELAVASQKNRVADRPHLGDDAPDQWFRDAVAVTRARVVLIHQRIAIEAAKVAVETGHRDPGDCFLIATARVRKVPLVTRDGTIRAISADRPDYLTVIVC
ncbi:type II toxin-antitoxin system VapC family toxin [Sphingomonas sp. PvP055]|uniref:type II toxin-antitoxin system VapC family toxin n=1 Tax=Sphingomonas sp. PvP055 TaxID=3156391 RepID=UPI003393A433